MDPSEALARLADYAQVAQEIEDIKAELPQLGLLEKKAEKIKKEIQEYVKEHGEIAGFGYEVKLAGRDSWDTNKLLGFAAAHPELNALKSKIKVATVRRQK